MGGGVKKTPAQATSGQPRGGITWPLSGRFLKYGSLSAHHACRVRPGFHIQHLSADLFMPQPARRSNLRGLLHPIRAAHGRGDAERILAVRVLF
jgi:hypothetical protein